MKERNTFLIACLCVYSALTALLIATVPINAAPDEGSHLEYAQHLATQKSLPVFEAKGANAPGYEFHQPPLYYALAAPASGVLQASAAAYAARAISLLCGALALAFLWHSLQLLFPDDEIIAPLAIGFATVWPLHIAVGASAGNDALAGAMCAGIFWSVARLAARIENAEYLPRDAVLIGVFFGLAMLSKSTSLVVGIAAVGAAFYLLRKKPSSSVWSTPGAAVGIVVATTLAICGWWLTRNTMLYGDPLAARIFDEAFAGSASRRELVQAATGAFGLDYLRAWLVILFSTCWGFFGGPNTAIAYLNPFGTHGPRFEAFTVLPLMLAPSLATFVAVWGFLKWGLHEWKTPSFSPQNRIALTWWFLGMLGVALVLLRFNMTYFQAQARYLHPALLPMSLVFALGWREILGEGKALRTFALCFAFLLLLLSAWNAFGWKTLV